MAEAETSVAGSISLTQPSEDDAAGTGPSPALKVPKDQLRTTSPFQPLLKIDKICKLLGFNCEILLKCTHLNPVGLSSYPLALQILEQDGDDDLKIVTHDGFELAVGLCFASAAKKCAPPVFFLTQNQSQSQSSSAISQNDLNLLRCLGTRIVRAPLEPGILDRQNCRPYFDQLHKQLNAAQSNRARLYSDITCLDSSTDSIESIRLLLFYSALQAQGALELFVCDSTMASIIESNQVLLESFTSMYDVASIEGQRQKNHEVQSSVRDTPHWRHNYQISEASTASMAYSLIHEEGLLCSQKSARIVAGAIAAIKNLGLAHNEKARVVVLLPESPVHGNLSWFQHGWMVHSGIWSDKQMEDGHCWWWEISLTDVGLVDIGVVYGTMTVAEAAQFMNEVGIDRVGIVLADTSSDRLVGVALLSQLQPYLEQSESEAVYADYDYGIDYENEPIQIQSVMSKNLSYADVNTAKLKSITTHLQHSEYLIVTRDNEEFGVLDEHVDGMRVVGIVKPEDIILYKKQILLEHLNQGYSLRG